MRALFCWDGPLKKDENGLYYDTVLNDRMFERYFKVCDKLELLIRVKNVKSDDIKGKMSQLTNPDISVTECPNLASVSGMIKNTAKVKKILKERIKTADLVFIRLPSTIGNHAVDCCKKLNKKYLIEVVGCPWDAYWNYSLKGKLAAPFATYMMKKRIKSASHVLYVTNEFLQGRYPTNGKSIPCSNVELKDFEGAALQKRFSKIDSYNENTKYVIGTAAALDVLYKGQQYVIEALGKLKQQGITCFEYQCIGGGSDEHLKNVARECGVEKYVNIVGQLSHDKVFEWLTNIDFYIQPSRQEGLPRSVIEAMSRALPCLGAKTAGIPELINPSCVFSNSKKEPDEIARLLVNLIKDKERMKKLAEENYDEAKKYERDTLIKRRTDFFKDYAEA